MRDRLKAEAGRNGRSLNSEIIHRLESTLGMDDLDQRLGPTDSQASFESNGTAEVRPDVVESLAAISKQLENVDLFEWMALMKELNARLGKEDNPQDSLNTYAHTTRKQTKTKKPRPDPSKSP
jgi:hypothetical protein